MKYYQELISITKNGSENLCMQNAYHDIKENLMIITKTCFLLELNILYISHMHSFRIACIYTLSHTLYEHACNNCHNAYIVPVSVHVSTYKLQNRILEQFQEY